MKPVTDSLMSPKCFCLYYGHDPFGIRPVSAPLLSLVYFPNVCTCSLLGFVCVYPAISLLLNYYHAFLKK